MQEFWRELRLCELHALKSTDPAKLISMYRGVASLSVDNRLPRGVSFTGMINAILDHEAAKWRADILPSETGWKR
jgi:hypothetical protein